MPRVACGGQTRDCAVSLGGRREDEHAPSSIDLSSNTGNYIVDKVN